MISSSARYNTRQLKQAMEWFVSLQSEQCPVKEQLLFETWLAKNASHRAAYAEAERVWSSMDDLKLLPIPGLDEARLAKPRQSTSATLASLAFFIVTTALFGSAWLEYSAETIHYSTRLGEHRRIELADNSHIDLNTDTHVSVKISPFQRDVHLTQGEALFDVSHNRLRPFTVQVGSLRVRDVGTQFNIRKQSRSATISVLEGEVELNDGDRVTNEHLIAGNQHIYTEHAGLGQVQPVVTNNLTAWVTGQLVFTHTPLSQVTAELQRYHAVHFSFADPSLAQETLSGTFSADDIDPFLHALETILPVKIKRNNQNIQLRRIPKNR